MNYQVDIMIVGDSKAGHEILDQIASSKPTIKLAFISKEFKSTTTRDYLNVEYFKSDVTFTDYKNRLFCCYLSNNKRVYGTHLIIASGLNYAPLMLNNEPVLTGVYNNADDVPKTAKNQPAVVVCNHNSEVELVLEVAKKYKQVYVCNKDQNIECLTKINAKKLNTAENIVILPNTNITKAIYDNAILQQVEFSNYSTVNCAAVYVQTDSVADTTFVSEKLIQKVDRGHLITSDNAESTLVPKCFAVGNCAQKYSKKIEKRLVETILSDF